MYVFLISFALAEEPRRPIFKASNIFFQESGGLSIRAEKANWNLKQRSGKLSGGVILTQEELQSIASSCSCDEPSFWAELASSED